MFKVSVVFTGEACTVAGLVSREGEEKARAALQLYCSPGPEGAQERK